MSADPSVRRGGAGIRSRWTSGAGGHPETVDIRNLWTTPARTGPDDLAFSTMTWTLPGYAPDELVGFGATGEVWRGRDLATGDPVAIKRLRVDDAGGRARLRREAALLTALDHPHLVSVREVVVTDRECALILDYAAGGSLAGLLRRRGRLRPGEVVTALAPVAAALAFAHGEGVVHGDVTPANVLFTADGRPLLADLGVARVVGDEDAVRATPDYVDPVVARGAAPGPASDVFALAAVAFHALTGVPPWNAATPEDTLAVAAAGELPALRELAPGTPEPLIDAVERALSAVPSARGGAADLALDVRHACPPEPVGLGGAPDGPPDAGPRAQLTHVVHRPGSTGGDAPPTPGQHRRPARRSLRPVHAVGGLVRAAAASRGLRLTVVGLAGLALAVRLGIAWAGSDPPSIPRGGSDLAATADTATPHGPADPPRTAVPGDRARPRSREHPPVTAAGPRSPVFTDREGLFAGVLDGLDADRAAAFAAADPARLAAVYRPDSPARAADARTLRQVAAAGLTVQGVRHDVRALHVLRDDGDRAVLEVTESLRPHVVVRGTRPMARSPAGTPRRYRLELDATPTGWRIRELTAVA